MYCVQCIILCAVNCIWYIVLYWVHWRVQVQWGEVKFSYCSALYIVCTLCCVFVLVQCTVLSGTVHCTECSGECRCKAASSTKKTISTEAAAIAPNLYLKYKTIYINNKLISYQTTFWIQINRLKEIQMEQERNMILLRGSWLGVSCSLLAPGGGQRAHLVKSCWPIDAVSKKLPTIINTEIIINSWGAPWACLVLHR